MDVCALCAMQLFLNDRLLFESDPEKPLFLYKNGIVLSRKLFVDSTRLYLCTIGTNSSRYTGHSYRVCFLINYLIFHIILCLTRPECVV